MVVLITDGRANISLARSNDDPEAFKPDAVKPTMDEMKVRVCVCVCVYRRVGYARVTHINYMVCVCAGV